MKNHLNNCSYSNTGSNTGSNSSSNSNYRCFLRPYIMVLFAVGSILIAIPALTSTCQAQTSPELNETIHNRAYKPPASAQKRKKIRRILQKAELAYLQERLTMPLDDNAYFHYLYVLALDPKNPTAIEGLNDIVERYLDLAINHANLFELKIANDFLMKARSVDDTHPNIKAVENRISQQRAARKNTITLSLAEVKGRSANLSRRLKEVGRTIALKHANVIIKAPSDAHGRWIYQQLNEGNESRVRAEFRVGERAQVMLLY